MDKEYLNNLLEGLGMVEEKPDLKTLLDVINFVQELTSYNDLHTIEQFLLCLFSDVYEVETTPIMCPNKEK